MTCSRLVVKAVSGAVTLAAILLGQAVAQPASVEEVAFRSGDLVLRGTLTLPSGPGPHPAVITLSGSGPQNRDGELPGIPGYRPFAQVAEHLSERGVAVLRYDDRGVAASKGDNATATSGDLAADARAAVRALQRRADVDALQIGLLGHSEGGMLAAMVASRDPGVAFVIALAPPVADPMAGLLLQERRMLETAGLPAHLVAERVALTREVLALTRAQDWLPLERLIRATVREQLQALPEAQRAAFGDLDEATEALVAQTMTQHRGWMHFFLMHDARRDWARLHVPALVLFGGLDVQVDLALHRDAVSSLNRPNLEIVTLAGANHLFQEADTGSVLEYAELTPELAPQVLRSVSVWLTALGVGGDR